MKADIHSVYSLQRINPDQIRLVRWHLWFMEYFKSSLKKDRFLKVFSGTVPAILVFLITLQTATAQNEWLSTLDYTTMTVKQIVNIPGVTYVKTDNSTFNSNTGLFFFQGNATGQLPYNLITVSTVTGAVMYNPVCPSNMGGEVAGLQIDKYSDSLFGLWLGGVSFCWIDPATGAIHLRGTIPNYAGYSWSAFQTYTHRYLVSNGKGMLVIDAWTGTVLFNLSLPNISNLYYDNVTEKLYGINLSGPTPQFDSITIATGAVHPVLNLPPMSLPQLYTCTIDEYAGKYIFLGADTSAGACISNYLYVIDLNTGTLDSRTPYPYAQGVNSPDQENLLEFSCGNYDAFATGHKVLALNWHLPKTTGVTIVADPESPCAGVPANFTATPGTGVVNPSFQWQINGTDIGTNSTGYTNNNLSEGDTIRCILTDHATCIAAAPDTSNFFVIGKALRDTVIISVSSETICTNGQITLIAKTTNAVASPVYQWFVNGKPVGTNNNEYMMAGPVNGDSIVCIVTTNATCILPDSSNRIIIQYASLDASVSIRSSEDAVCSGETLLFTATAMDAGPTPTYQWQINGISTGTGKDTLMAASLKDGDQVSCIMTGGITCSHPVLSNSITAMVKMSPFVFAGNDTVISPGKSVTFNPSVSAPVSSWLWTPPDNLDNSSIPTPTASPAVSTTYRLTVTSDDGCQSSGTIKVIIYHPLKMPNAFTPNGDGLNDLFRIPPVTTQNIQTFSVFNRWGQLLFRTKDSGAGWDGFYNGQLQPPGTYVWEIQYQDGLSKKTELARGTVELVR